jgi:hypothetical protein
MNAERIDMTNKANESTGEDRVRAIISRPATVTITLTQNQADTLWWLLERLMGRDQFGPKTKRTLNQIGARVAKATGLRWLW